MRMKQSKKSLSFVFCMMLIVAMALFTSGCNDKKTQAPSVQEMETSVTEKAASEAEVQMEESFAEQSAKTEVTVLGEGESRFLFTVVDKEGTETAFEIHTDRKTVGEALLELGLIAGEESEFGLFVKSVNGITADYEIDKTYWAFYINGEYAVTGVDTTVIEENSTYMFKVEK